MININDHALSHQIRHELSGMGRISSLSGSVLDNGYTAPTLVDVSATVDGNIIECVTSRDEKIVYLANGSEITLPAPQSYADPMDFTTLTSSVIQRVEADHATGKAALARKNTFWQAGVIAVSVLVLIGAFRLSEPSLAFVAMLFHFFFGIMLRPWAPKTDVYGTELNRTDISLDPFVDEHSMSVLHTGLVRLANQEGVKFIGGVRGAVSGGVGYVLFNGTHPDYRGPRSFMVNHSATEARHLRHLSEYHFTSESIREDEDSVMSA